MPCPNEAIQFGCTFCLFFLSFVVNGKKITFVKKNHFFKVSNLTTNIVTLLNIEPILGFMLGIKRVKINLQGYTVSTMHLNIGHLLR